MKPATMKEPSVWSAYEEEPTLKWISYWPLTCSIMKKSSDKSKQGATLMLILMKSTTGMEQNKERETRNSLKSCTHKAYLLHALVHKASHTRSRVFQKRSRTFQVLPHLNKNHCLFLTLLGGNLLAPGCAKCLSKITIPKCAIKT